MTSEDKIRVMKHIKALTTCALAIAQKYSLPPNVDLRPMTDEVGKCVLEAYEEAARAQCNMCLRSVPLTYHIERVLQWPQASGDGNVSMWGWLHHLSRSPERDEEYRYCEAGATHNLLRALKDSLVPVESASAK